MGKELEDIEFDELLAEKRHKELSGILKAVKGLLERPADTSTAAAIQKMAGELSVLLSEQKPVPITLKSPDVNVTVDNKEVVNLMEKLLPELIKFNNKPIPTQFDVENNYGNLRTVKIVYTTADKLTYKK